jgi:hypothetical protein
VLADVAEKRTVPVPPGRRGDEDPADADLVVEGESGDEMAGVLDLSAVVSDLVEHDEDVDVRLGGGVAAGMGAEEVDALKALGIELLEPGA